MLTFDYGGKTVFCAGASRGINLEIARGFAEAGARVFLIARSEERLQQALQQLADEGSEADGRIADVRDYAAVEAALTACRDRFGPIDVVISGAAGNFVAPALGMSSNGFRTVVEIDLIGTFNVFRAAFAHLRRPGASLIAISATQGERPMTFQAHVCAAKAGINRLVECLAMEWGPAGVRVNGISPGPIAGTYGADVLLTDARAAELKANLALRRLGETKEIAHAALFMASDLNRYMTGTIVDIDGGVRLGDASADAVGAWMEAEKSSAKADI